jgi:hypothetical protein
MPRSERGRRRRRRTHLVAGRLCHYPQRWMSMNQRRRGRENG